MSGKIERHRFRHHALAVLGAAMVGATIYSLIWTVGVGVALAEQRHGMAWLWPVAMAGLAVVLWLSTFMVTLLSAGVGFSLLLPLMRRGTAASKCIYILAGATIGVMLGALSNEKGWSTLLFVLANSAAVGGVVAISYLVIVKRLDRRAGLVIDTSIFGA